MSLRVNELINDGVLSLILGCIFYWNIQMTYSCMLEILTCQSSHYLHIYFVATLLMIVVSLNFAAYLSLSLSWIFYIIKLFGKSKCIILDFYTKKKETLYLHSKMACNIICYFSFSCYVSFWHLFNLCLLAVI